MRASVRCWHYRRPPIWQHQKAKRPRPKGIRLDADAVPKLPIINAERLTQAFAPESAKMHGRLLTQSQTWWKRASQELEWTLTDYDEIPDVKVARLETERLQRQLAWQPGDNPVRQKRSSYGYNPTWLKPLPEVMFLGHTNAGKLLLLNALLPKEALARVAKQPGYTKTVNCYNIGQKLRLLDTPGYGGGGEENQGKMVLDYLERRRQCRKVYIVVDAKKGFVDHDLNILEHVVSLGIQVDIVLTKVDEIIQREYWRLVKVFKGRTFLKKDLRQMAYDINTQITWLLKRRLSEGGITDESRAYPVNVLFFNSQTQTFVPKVGGVVTLCADIYRTTGLFEPPAPSQKRPKSQQPPAPKEASQETSPPAPAPQQSQSQSQSNDQLQSTSDQLSTSEQLSSDDSPPKEKRKYKPNYVPRLEYSRRARWERKKAYKERMKERQKSSPQPPRQRKRKKPYQLKKKKPNQPKQ